MNVFEKIKESFDRQGLMRTLGGSLESVESGKVTIAVTFHDSLSQQDGYFHAGVLTSIADSACGYAALSVAEDQHEVLTVEFKINFLKPAATKRLLAIGRVVQSGKTLTICEGTVYDETESKVLAKMMATIITVKANR